MPAAPPMLVALNTGCWPIGNSAREEQGGCTRDQLTHSGCLMHVMDEERGCTCRQTRRG